MQELISYYAKYNTKNKESFLELQKENAIIKSILQEETYCDMLWDEHIEDKALMFSIEAGGEYAGYCGIKNTTSER